MMAMPIGGGLNGPYPGTVIFVILILNGILYITSDSLLSQSITEELPLLVFITEDFPLLTLITQAVATSQLYPQP